MRKQLRRVFFCLTVCASVWCGALLADRQDLNETIIRFHVVANSDSEEDQAVKLRVRDAVLGSIQQDLRTLADVEEARRYLQQNLPKIRKTADLALAQLGVEQEAAVTFCREAFDTRRYDTFTLPAGVYESLRIVIGDGAGKNWWCVAFPGLCLPATQEDFGAAAVGAGFSEPLTESLTGEPRQLRFFLLDSLGRLENRLFQK